MAVQEVNKLNFGSARMWGLSQAGVVLPYGQLQDLSVDMKTDIKEAYAEGNFAFATASGHVTIDLNAKHYIKNLTSISNDFNGSAVSTNSTGIAVDEQGSVAAGAYNMANVNILTLFELIVGVPGPNGTTVPTLYQVFTGAGSPVAGVSAKLVPATGVLTFATADNGYPVRLSYTWTLGTPKGNVIAIGNTYQNSSPTFKITAVKRDLSPIDGSVGYEVWTFNAVRPGGIKNEWKEGDYTVLDRTMKAFADPMGNVATIFTLNQ
jgi:predicted secreted protein